MLNVVVAVNNAEVLGHNLLASPDVAAGRIHCRLVGDSRTAMEALKRGMESVTSTVVALIHQDVYLPFGWLARVERVLMELQSAGTRWGVLGVWGIGWNRRMCGRVWCTGGGQEHRGLPPLTPSEVATIDEIVILLNRDARFEPDLRLPGYHLYATDLAMQALDQGFKTYVIDAPVVHNSATKLRLDSEYYECYRYMQQKWQHRLPVPTPVLELTRYGMPIVRRRLGEVKQTLLARGRIHARHPDPAQLSHELGYDA